MPGPYEGVHGFVFLYEGDPRPPSEVIDDLLQHLDPDHGPVFFASTFEGDFAGFAHFAADDLEQLVDFTGSTLFDAGIRSDYATEGSVHRGAGGPKGPKRKSPRFCAICRVRTNDRPKLVLAAIAEEFGDAKPFMGGSRVVARFPLLIELGADDEPGLTAAIERLGNVSGVQAMKVGTTDTKKADAPAT
ncbi:MAG TPA: hypothetical protein VIX39_09340 [Actinomycetota bacterium]